MSSPPVESKTMATARHLPRRSKKLRVSIVLIIIAFLAIGFYFRSVVAMFTLLEYYEWRDTREIRRALENPRSVIVSEYVGDTILARLACTPEQLSALRKATNKPFRPFTPQVALCFEPHHNINILRTDGSTLQVYLCFLCGNFSLHDNPPGLQLDIPPYWTESLVSFFRDLGMAPKTDAEYSDLARSRSVE